MKSTGNITTLKDYIKLRKNEEERDPVLKSPYGASREGNFLNAWQMASSRIELFTRSYGIPDFHQSGFIEVMVPPVGPGIHALIQDSQPFGWTGQINDFTAELALWHAFEILTQDEATEFMEKYSPVVIFMFHYRGYYQRLEVQYRERSWFVINE